MHRRNKKKKRNNPVQSLKRTFHCNDPHWQNQVPLGQLEIEILTLSSRLYSCMFWSIAEDPPRLTSVRVTAAALQAVQTESKLDRPAHFIHTMWINALELIFLQIV